VSSFLFIFIQGICEFLQHLNNYQFFLLVSYLSKAPAATLQCDNRFKRGKSRYWILSFLLQNLKQTSLWLCSVDYMAGDECNYFLAWLMVGFVPLL